MVIGERWRPVVGHRGAYEVSNRGQVRSLPRTMVRRNGNPYTARGVMLKPWAFEHGHLMVNIHHKGVQKGRYVHQLVLEAFVGPKPSGMGCRHLDGDPRNNRLSNLRWGTPKENSEDMIAHGRSTKKVLSDEIILSIRQEYAEGFLSIGEIARKFNLSQTFASAVIRGKRSGHLPVLSEQPAADEEWRPIPLLEGSYEVSSHGEIRSVDRMVMRKDGIAFRSPSTVLKIKGVAGGRPGWAMLPKNGSRYRYCVVDLVQEVFGIKLLRITKR